MCTYLRDLLVVLLGPFTSYRSVTREEEEVNNAHGGADALRAVEVEAGLCEPPL